MDEYRARGALHRLKGATTAYIELLQELQPIFAKAAIDEPTYARVRDAAREALDSMFDSVGTPTRFLAVVEDQLEWVSDRRG